MTHRERAVRIVASTLVGLFLFGAGYFTGGRVERAHAGGWEKLMDLVSEAKKLNGTIKDLELNIEKLKQNAGDLKQMRDRLDPTYKKQAK